MGLNLIFTVKLPTYCLVFRGIKVHEVLLPKSPYCSSIASYHFGNRHFHKVFIFFRTISYCVHAAFVIQEEIFRPPLIRKTYSNEFDPKYFSLH